MPQKEIDSFKRKRPTNHHSFICLGDDFARKFFFFFRGEEDEEGRLEMGCAASLGLSGDDDGEGDELPARKNGRRNQPQGYWVVEIVLAHSLRYNRRLFFSYLEVILNAESDSLEGGSFLGGGKYRKFGQVLLSWRIVANPLV